MRASALLDRVCLALVAPMAIAAVSMTGCVDAPITADQLEADGSLRGGSAAMAIGDGVQQAAFAAEESQVAQVVRVSAVLAAQADGPLEDRAQFDVDVGTVYLHVRADGLLDARSVTYRWRHDDFVAEIPGALQASNAMSLGASFEIPADQTGHWEVDVIADSPEGTPDRVLFHREFVVGNSL